MLAILSTSEASFESCIVLPETIMVLMDWPDFAGQFILALSIRISKLYKLRILKIALSAVRVQILVVIVITGDSPLSLYKNFKGPNETLIGIVV